MNSRASVFAVFSRAALQRSLFSQYVWYVVTMIEHITKPKLPKTLSYVLKTSQLAKALANAEIDCHVSLKYWTPTGGGYILQALYWLPNARVSYPRVYISAGTVPVAWQTAASEAFLASALPAFIHWLQAILALPDNSSALNKTPSFEATYTEKGLAISSQPDFNIRERVD